MTGSSAPSTALIRAAPILFVLIWSTGWISAGFGAHDADPLTFLSLRYALAAICLVVISVAFGASWPARGLDVIHALVSGILLHAVYLGGVWWAIGHGLPAGLSGLIAALQPILTALMAPIILGEALSLRRWSGIFVGLAGIALVLWPKLAGVDLRALDGLAWPILINVIAMLSVTFGTFYQKRFIATGDLRTVTVLQYAGACAVTLPVALMTESLRLNWTPTLILTMAWSVLALSIGAIGLLLMLLRRGEVSRAAALIYLVPQTVALQAFFFFGETMSPGQMLGLVVAALGVALAVGR
jgi:drug/metabolite transporter (DMT)-like permease